MGFFRELIKLTRFEHALMLALGVLISETIVIGRLPPSEYYILLSLLVPIFSEMGSFALNDYFDIETDRLNKKTDRPLVKGTISPGFAMGFSVLSILLSILLAYLINQTVFIIALIFNLLGIAYNWRLKDLPLIGNAYIALTMSIPFIFGNFVVATQLSQLAFILALLGFVAGLAREIIKSVQDMRGDAVARNSKTLPLIIGKKPAIIMAVVLYLFFIPLSAWPFTLGLSISFVPISMIATADVLILAICYKMITYPDKSFGFARNISLVAFLLGMLGLLVAVL